MSFPISNLPYGVFRRLHSDDGFRVGVAIGDSILDVGAALRAGLISPPAREAAEACEADSLNGLMAMGRTHWSALRAALTELLTEGTELNARAASRAEGLFTRMEDAELTLPAKIGDYTDFYASIHHATNVGSMFRPDNPLLPNYKWVPIGYHGRASSIVPSGTEVRRPHGQRKAPDATEPTVGPCRMLDYEMELGAFVGPGNALGETISIENAEDHLFGVCLVNDWSARDMQAWEYQPLGPFLAKSFATSISPWVVTMDALAPYRAPAFERAPDDPRPLPYLDHERDRTSGGIAINVEVSLRTARMRETNAKPHVLSRGSFTDMYWTFAQMLTHHASNGCNLRPGDLIASGTISGSTPDSRGSLLELTWRGRDPIELPDGETRTFLQDGDEVIMRGWCGGNGTAELGLGEVRGVVRD
jgi:fumarylacetoacetase